MHHDTSLEKLKWSKSYYETIHFLIEINANLTLKELLPQCFLWILTNRITKVFYRTSPSELLFPRMQFSSLRKFMFLQ